MHRRTFSVFFFAFSSSIALAASPVQERADHFLRLANAGFQALFRVNAEAQWTAVTDVTPAARRGGGSDRQSFRCLQWQYGDYYGNARSAHAREGVNADSPFGS